MRDFLRDLNSEHTSQSYATPLRHFDTYLQGEGIHADRDPVTSLTVDHAIGFVPWLRHDHFTDPDRPAKATLQLYLTALYRFYRALLKQGVPFDAAEIARLEETYRDARNIRGEARPKDPKLAAVQAVIQAARAVPPVSGDSHAQEQRELARLRDIAIVETLRSTGCRVGELVSLRRADLDWMAHSALVKGKGNKYRKVYLDDRAWSAVKIYLQARQDDGSARALSRYPVFCGHGNRSGRTPSPLTTRHVSRTVRHLAELADVAEVGVTPHYFRHVFATRALERTENLALVQDMLGHASPATTRVYAKTDERQRREGFARVWDRDRFEQRVEALAARGGSFETAVSILRAARVAPDEVEADADRWARLQRAAMVEILWSTGCTLDQLLVLDRESVDVPASALRLAFFQGDERVDLDGRAWRALRAYLEVRDELATEALFCAPDGARLTREQAVAALRALAADRDAHFFPDLLRGVFIHRALEAVDDPKVVELMVGGDLSAAERVEVA
jgi:site-specific recombinase XerD